MIIFDKTEIKNKITLDNIFDLLQEWGGDPTLTDFGIISSTICHNSPGEGSKKLYFYENSGLFRCYTGCDSTFDIFELAIKVMQIQNNIDWDLNEAIRFVAYKFGIAGTQNEIENSKLEDWRFIANYNRIQEIKPKEFNVTLKEYNDYILKNFNYSVKIIPWIKEGITKEVMDFASIGFYPGGD